MEGEILARLRKVEKALEVLLELHPEARARLEPHQEAVTGLGAEVYTSEAPPTLPGYAFVGSGTVKDVRVRR